MLFVGPMNRRNLGPNPPCDPGPRKGGGEPPQSKNLAVCPELAKSAPAFWSAVALHHLWHVSPQHRRASRGRDQWCPFSAARDLLLGNINTSLHKLRARPWCPHLRSAALRFTNLMKAAVWRLLMVLLCLAGCNRSQNSIVGVWSEAGTGTVIRFESDGIVRIIAGSVTTTGTYSFEPPSSLTLRFDGSAPKPGPHKPVCSLHGDTMQLKWAGDDTLVQYNRLKQ